MSKKILIVDDEPSIVELIRRILVEEGGFDVATAVNGNEALAALEGGGIDLILLDVLMPDVSGFDLCRTLKQDQRYKDIPVVFVTAKEGGDSLLEGLESGGAMYLAKPISIRKLLAVVGTMLKVGPHQLS
jgi:two-component system cell cycle response regulator